MPTLKSQLESILFVSSKPLNVKQISKFLHIPDEEVHSALLESQEDRKNTGVILLEANGFWQMATHSENSETVKNFLNADLREKLTDATIEVLSIIAYRQPISKAEIEAIRGVNSQYSVRHLLMRGLIEKIPNPNDARGSLYQVTTEFLQQLGIQSTNDLPEFEKLVAHIKLPETPQVTDMPENPEDPIEEQIGKTTSDGEETGIIVEEVTIAEVATSSEAQNTEPDEIEDELDDEDDDDDDEEDDK